MSSRSTSLALAVATALAIVLGLPAFSAASYVRSTVATAAVTAAADWTPPTVAMLDPGSSVKGSVPLSATSTDGETGVASVTLQYFAPNATGWTTICTDVSAPFGCTWDTTGLADGGYSLRATAVDKAGYTATSGIVGTTVANKLLVVLTDPGDVVRGTVPLAATVHNPGALSWSVRFEYSPAGADQWRSIGTDSSAPYTIDWTTTSGSAAVASGDYDLRVVATSGTVSYTSVVRTDVTVDNVAPSVTMNDPGTPLRGTVTLSATAGDAHSGLARVVIQYASATGVWRDACTLSESPYSCSFATTQLTDGTYSFRAVATDLAGATTTSTVVGSRVVDNTVSSVSVTDPGAYLSGTVTVAASANSSAGIASVRVQRSPAGSSTWTDLCTDTLSPYSCSWDTTQVGDGFYDLRAILTDGAGRTTTSAVVTNRRVDNTPFRGVDVQTVNGGAIAGRLDAGDQLVLTFSKVLTPSTVSSGWDGSATAATLRLRDGTLLGLGSRGDTLDVLRNGVATNLGSVNLREDYVKTNKVTQFNATMALTTVTVNGAQVSRVTVTATGLASGGALRTVTALAAMVWSPAAAVLDLSGLPVSTAPVTESGVADREF